MNWFRMYAEFATDQKVQMLSESDQRRLCMLFCIRCSNGDVTLHDDEVTFLLRISPEEWGRTKALFVARGFTDEDNKILNWDKRQYRSDSSAARVAEHRARKKHDAVTSRNVTVTPPDTDTDTDTDTDNRKSKKKEHASPIGSRLPENFPSPDEIAWAKSKRPEVDAELELQKFRDFWLSKAGKDGRKADWPATWRNWIRNSRGNYASNQRNRESAADRAARLAREGDEREAAQRSAA